MKLLLDKLKLFHYTVFTVERDRRNKGADNMTSQEMMKAQCGKGQHFENIAELGESPDWVFASLDDAPNWVLRDYPLGSVDPNIETIFGYESKAFMARQYK